jgi:hypothetical protein
MEWVVSHSMDFRKRFNQGLQPIRVMQQGGYRVRTCPREQGSERSGGANLPAAFDCSSGISIDEILIDWQ